MKKFIYICELLLFIVFLVLILFTKSKLAILLGIPIFILVYLFSRRINIKNFALFIFIFAFLIRLFSILILNVEIADDFKTMLTASKSLIDGNLDFTNTFYFKTFSYQIGHVLYQAILLKVINSVLFLKIINSIITAFIAVFIYLISKNIYEEKIARVISLSYLFYLYPLYLNSVLTNQHLPALICLIVIYLLITKQINTKLLILIGLLLGTANILRTESIIFILGIIIYFFLTNKNTKKNITNSLVLIITYFIFINLVSYIVYISPINLKLENKAPYWKFYCGLNYATNGIYNEADQDIFFNSSNQKQLLIDRIKNDKHKFPVLFLKKEVILWTQTNYDLRITNNIDEALYNFLLLYNQGYLNLVFLLFVISLFPNKSNIKESTLLIKILIAVYFGIYMFIEISPRYAYILHILLFLLLGVGINYIQKKVIHE